MNAGCQIARSCSARRRAACRLSDIQLGIEREASASRRGLGRAILTHGVKQVVIADGVATERQSIDVVRVRDLLEVLVRPTDRQQERTISRGRRAGEDSVINVGQERSRTRVEFHQRTGSAVVEAARTGVAAAVAKQPSVRSHHEVLQQIGIPGRIDVGVDTCRARAIQRVDRDEIVGAVLMGVQHHVAEVERFDMRVDGDRVGDVDQWPRCRVNRRAVRGVAGEADVIFRDAPQRRDRFQTGRRGIARGAQEVGAECLRLQLVVDDREIVELVRRSRLFKLRRADVRVQRADRAARQVVHIIALAGSRLVISDVRFTTDVDQLTVLSEDRDGRIGPSQAVGPIQVDDRRPGLAAVVQAGDLLNPRVVDVELVEVDITVRVQITAGAEVVPI